MFSQINPRQRTSMPQARNIGHFFFILSWLRILFRSFFKKNTVDCYSISPHGFCFATVFPHMFFSKLSLSIFFNIELIGNLALTFPTCFFFHFVLLFFHKIVFFFHFFWFFFQNCLYWFYFFNMELIENLALKFFLKNIVDYYSVSPHNFFLWFFFVFFSRIVFAILFFSYWTSWEFSFVVLFLNTVDCYSILTHDFFQNYLYWFYYF